MYTCVYQCMSTCMYTYACTIIYTCRYSYSHILLCMIKVSCMMLLHCVDCVYTCIAKLYLYYTRTVYTKNLVSHLKILKRQIVFYFHVSCIYNYNYHVYVCMCVCTEAGLCVGTNTVLAVFHYGHAVLER